MTCLRDAEEAWDEARSMTTPQKTAAQALLASYMAELGKKSPEAIAFLEEHAAHDERRDNLIAWLSEDSFRDCAQAYELALVYREIALEAETLGMEQLAHDAHAWHDLARTVGGLCVDALIDG
ncbi:hypothetical protein ASD16_21295 [Cellulomonas sp. Root485]|jgi:hypothetical protein|nr:hypothetical protein ASD16_21295 [Cellulomonas sp. Root485]